VKRLYATESVDEAQRIQALLKSAGIESSLETKSGGGVITGAVVFGIYIEDKDAAEAVGILAGWLEKDLDPEEPDLPMTETEDPSG
jgi:type III secretory pathway lipoprotein EscJ